MLMVELSRMETFGGWQGLSVTITIWPINNSYDVGSKKLVHFTKEDNIFLLVKRSSFLEFSSWKGSYQIVGRVDVRHGVGGARSHVVDAERAGIIRVSQNTWVKAFKSTLIFYEEHEKLPVVYQRTYLPLFSIRAQVQNFQKWYYLKFIYKLASLIGNCFKKSWKFDFRYFLSNNVFLYKFANSFLIAFVFLISLKLWLRC